MVATNTFRFGCGAPIVLWDGDKDDDGDEDEKPITLKALNEVIHGAISSSEKKQLARIEKMLKGKSSGGGGVPDESALDKLVEKLLGDDGTSGSDDADHGKDAGDDSKDGGDHIPHGLRVRLESLEKKLGKEASMREDLQEQIKERDEALAKQRRSHNLEKLLDGAEAYNSKQVAALIMPEIVEDEEIGDAVPVKTEAGDDLIPLAEYVAKYKEENDYLFRPPEGSGKSGSGSGGGSAGRDKAKTTAEDLKPQSEGGMSWKEYEKKREEIHADLESSR